MKGKKNLYLYELKSIVVETVFSTIKINKATWHVREGWWIIILS